MSFFTNMFDNTARDLKRYQAAVQKINALEPEIAKLSNEEMRAKADELRQRVQCEYKAAREKAEPGWAALTDIEVRAEDRQLVTPILNDVLPEAFALVREASKRTIGLRHYDVQMIGAMVLHEGRIAEMKTGEGKTLVATCPIFLNSLVGRGAHLVTVNDYLSKRDAVWNGPIYHLLGCSVGIIQGQSPETGDEGGSYQYDPDYFDPDPRYTNARPITRAEAYGCDISYGTNNEFGFDYLRDNMAFAKEELVQRDLFYAIVDEVDSILIDEARTPLIISGFVQQSTTAYADVDRVVAQMVRGIDDPKSDKDNPDADKLNPNIHYVVDEKAKTATITDTGVTFVEQRLGVPNISDNHELMHFLSGAMKAHGVFRKDIDYVVKDNGEGPEIIIVDENTGRLMFGRRYSDGLHQAIEAKEHVEIKHESQTLATITFQNYFRLYVKLAGMTGTAKTEEEEFRKIYALDVLLVPTNMPVVRKDHPDVIFKSVEHKMRGISDEILRVYCKQQPVLVGTRSIEMSERVSSRLRPSALSLLCMIEVARAKLEATKSVPADKRRDYTALLNTAIDANPGPADSGEGKRNQILTMGKLRPLLRELGIDEDPLSPDNMNEIARIFQITDEGLDRLEEALTHGIPHNILNAKFHEKEAIIISEAGRKGAVTIATNMAGRGVDILLGGKHVAQELPPVDGSTGAVKRADEGKEEAGDGQDGSSEGAEESEPQEQEEEESFRRYGKPSVLDAVTIGALTDEDHKRAAREVCELGGLYILGTERHESRRIDNQLRGRSGRQGDPGESRFFVSLEDELWRLFGDRSNHPLLRTWEEHLSMDAKMLSAMIERAQKKIEQHYFEARKHTLNYDDVNNRQRTLIYAERRRILEGVDLKETILQYITETIQGLVAVHTPAEVHPDDWDLDELFRDLDGFFLLYPIVTPNDLKNKSSQELVDFLTEHVLNVYESREKELTEKRGQTVMRDLERWMALRAINARWMEHLANMEFLREGIHLRGYEQRDPLLIYQKEAFEEFERMQQFIQDDIVRDMFQMQIVDEPPPARHMPLPDDLGRTPGGGRLNMPMDVPQLLEASGSDGQTTLSRRDGAPPGWKGGRNDPCYCGSGLKFKKCHGK